MAISTASRPVVLEAASQELVDATSTPTMNEPRDNHSDRQLQFLWELLEEHASIDGDVVEFGKDTWAIHGVLPYDGEVPIAVFDTCDEAKHVLEEVRGATRG